MADQSAPPVMSIGEDDLLVVARAITMRCPLPATESLRAARLRALALVAAQLGRTLSTYARHALVNCQGTAGASDVELDTRLLVEALRGFATEVESVSSSYAESLPPDAHVARDKPQQPGVATHASRSPRLSGRTEPMSRALQH